MPAQVVRALRHRNYRLFFGGQTISLVGTWITRIATSWLVYRLTGSELLLGVVGFAGQIPLLVLAPFTGVLVDRWSRHRILVVTQILSALQSLALAVLALTGVMSGEQFALPEAVERMREIRRTPADGKVVIISAADPLNLTGVITSGDRVRAVLATRIAYRDGIAVSMMEGDFLRPLAGRSVPVTSGFVGRV